MNEVFCNASSHCLFSMIFLMLLTGRFNNKDSNERDYDYDNDRWYGQDNNRRQPGRGNGDSHSYGSHRREQNDDNRYNKDPFNRHFNTSRIGTTSIGSPLENIDAVSSRFLINYFILFKDCVFTDLNAVLYLNPCFFRFLRVLNATFSLP